MASGTSGSGIGLRGRGLGRERKDFGEFEVDDAEAAECVGVGDVAGFGVEVADAIVTLEGGEEFV